MWGAIKNIPEAIRGWKDSRSLLYSLVAGACAGLVAATWDGGRRPSDVIAWIARGIGAAPIARWFGTDAPPMLEAQNPGVQIVALGAVLILLFIMVITPVLRDVREGGTRDAPRALLLLGSPSASTVWVLLLIATQQGEIAPVIRAGVLRGSAVGVAVVVILTVVASAAHHLDRKGDDGRIAGHLMRAVGFSVRIVFSAGMAAFAILFAAVSTALMIVRWTCALQSDHSRAVSDEIEQARGERRTQPTGADVVPLSTRGGQGHGSPGD